MSAACAARIWPFHPHTNHKRHASSTKPKPHLPAAQTPVQQRTYTTAHSLNLCPQVLSYLSGVENESRRWKEGMNWGNRGNVTIRHRCKMCLTRNMESSAELKTVILYWKYQQSKGCFYVPLISSRGQRHITNHCTRTNGSSRSKLVSPTLLVTLTTLHSNGPAIYVFYRVTLHKLAEALLLN